MEGIKGMMAMKNPLIASIASIPSIAYISFPLKKKKLFSIFLSHFDKKGIFYYYGIK